MISDGLLHANEDEDEMHSNEDETHFPPVPGKCVLPLPTPGSGTQEKVLPRAGGAQAAEPGLGVGCLDLVNGSGMLAMVLHMGLNHEGGLWEGAAILCSQGLYVTGELTRPCCGLPTVESPEHVFYQYSFHAIPIFSFCFGEGRLLEPVSCSSTPSSSPALWICIRNPPVLVT